MKQISHNNNFIYLCVSLVFFLFAASLVQTFSGTLGEDFFSVVTLGMLFLSMKSVHTQRPWKKIVYLLIVVLFVLMGVTKMLSLTYVPYVILTALLIFFMGSFWVAYKQILFEGKVDGNKLIGSLSLYLLLGLIWTVLYLILIQLDASAFSGIETGNWKQNFAQVAYYSFVTLTTLGYGDILPKSHVAQFFVYIEATIGVFYMAIIVSSLISLRLSSVTRKG